MFDSSSDEEGGSSFVPALLQRPKVANHVVHESFTVDTRDHEDHTFCGVMFDICCRDATDGGVPLDFLRVDAVSVRGDLGPLTVWTTPETFRRKEHEQAAWECIYEQTHGPSTREFVKLQFTKSIHLAPGQSCGIYVHSKLAGDDAIVYDNMRSRYTYEDEVFRVLPGMAHLSNRPFGRHGMWGFPWRESREFVGRFYYGVGYRLWNPEVHVRFPVEFREAVRVLLLCARRTSSPLHAMQDEVIYYILNMCKYDWFRIRHVAKAPPASQPTDFRPMRGSFGYTGPTSWPLFASQQSQGLFPNNPMLAPVVRRRLAESSSDESEDSIEQAWRGSGSASGGVSGVPASAALMSSDDEVDLFNPDDSDSDE